MTKRIILELFYFIATGIGAIFIMAFILLFEFAGRLNNIFFHIVIGQNFLDNPFQGLVALWFILTFIIKLIKQKKLNFNDFTTNYILIFSGFGLIYSFSRFILNAQIRKEDMIAESIFYAKEMNVIITADKFNPNFKYYNYEIILLSSLLLIVGFIIIKTILKTKKTKLELSDLQ